MSSSVVVSFVKESVQPDQPRAVQALEQRISETSAIPVNILRQVIRNVEASQTPRMHV